MTSKNRTITYRIITSPRRLAVKPLQITSKKSKNYNKIPSQKDHGITDQTMPNYEISQNHKNDGKNKDGDQ